MQVFRRSGDPDTARLRKWRIGLVVLLVIIVVASVNESSEERPLPVQRKPFVVREAYNAAVHSPRVVGLEVHPTMGTDTDLSDGWQGLALYEVAEFRVVPIWSDGKPDRECSRAGSTPRWRCTYGWFEGEKEALDKVTMAVPGTAIAVAKNRPVTASGSRVIWSTDFQPKRTQPAEGVISVSYGGVTASIPVRTTNPDYSRFQIGRTFMVTTAPLHEDEQGQTLGNFLLGIDRKTPKSFRSAEYFARKGERVRTISRSLQQYIQKWLQGEAPADIPPAVLLNEPGLVNLTNACGAWTLVRAEDAKPGDQWVVRPAMEADSRFQELYYMSPDPHCTYLLLPYIAPLGSKLVVEGEFPRCRFMNFQVPIPYNPRFPAFAGAGIMEVPLVDADIEPEQGHVNPFRVGENRHAAKRRYRVEFLVTEGDPVSLNEKVAPGSMTDRPVAFRGQGNLRVCGAFVETGAWGKGTILPGVLWLRYYAPDRNAGPLGGVPLPKVYLELPCGERVWIRHDLRLMRRLVNVPVPAQPRAPEDYRPFNSRVGWVKMNDGFTMFGDAAGISLADVPLARSLMGGEDGLKQTVRTVYKEFFGRGPTEPPPANYWTGSTFCAYIHYLGRIMSLPEGKVLVITGKLPQTPRTRKGERVMRGGQARYWSLSRYGASPSRTTSGGLCYDSIMDDEVITDKEGWYCLVFSSPEDRPRNATPSAGVTWRNWGPDRGKMSMVIRWLMVMPDWHDPQYAPDDNNIPWHRGSWCMQEFQETLVSLNMPGVLRDYHPSLHLMTREQFEALGAKPNPRRMPHRGDW